MSKQAINALNRKQKKKEQLEALEKEIKELEERAQIELGKYLMKEWNIEGNESSKNVFDVISILKQDAKELLSKSDMGKSEDQTTQKTL